MARRLAALLVVACLVVFPGCRIVRVDTAHDTGPREDHRVDRWLWGIISGYHDIERPATVARVDVTKAFTDYVLSFITLGIYVPVTVTVWYVDEEPPPAPAK
ncbi:MAG: hypothetical protein KF878_29450 [Planctomycetes bacterium]|nr:hypothetical protein [Planctomycetota bacterium]MCW8138825.1 hypothetical protein [Planctomycetota bacterium]